MFIVRHYLIYEDSIKLISLTEYAAVGYIAKRIEMRKKRYQNLQKLAEQRRAAMAANNSGLDGETSTVAKSHVQYLVMSTTAQSPPISSLSVLLLFGVCPLTKSGERRKL